MSTVTEIKNAIDRLTPTQRRELEQLLWPDWDQPGFGTDNPPGIREKLQSALDGKFQPGSRSNAQQIIASLK